MIEKCDECGTELIDNCIICGAPVCCPRCCERDHLNNRIAELKELILNAGPLHWVAHNDMDGAKAWEKRAAELIPLHIPEGGADELISPKGIVTSKKAYERFHAEGG